MKKIKILTITLVIILITMIAFFGIYSQVQNRMENKVRGYSYDMGLSGTRNIRLKVDTTSNTIIKDSEGNEVEDAEELTDEELAEKGYIKEEDKINPEEVLNVENYEKSKEIIEKRLNELQKTANVGMQYEIKLDETNGDIIIEIPESGQTDTIVSNINTVGKFEIIDTETEEVLMDNSDIKTAKVMYGSSSTSTSYGTTVYLDIEFTKEGAKKLEEISSKYVKVEENTETTAEDETSEEKTDEEDTENEEEVEDTTNTEKTITMKIDDEEIMTTSFEEPIATGSLQLSVGSSTTDTKTLQGYIDQSTTMATILKTGNLPITYTIEENEYVFSDITNNEIKIAVYTILALVIIALIVLIIRYKTNGVLGTISYIGLASLFLILIRYTNVVLSIEGIFGIAIVLLLNYIFVNKLLSKTRGKELSLKDIKEATKETYKEFFIRIIPICIAVITFCFIKWVPISSFGMVMFWGIALIAVYNYIITSNLLKIKTNK